MKRKYEFSWSLLGDIQLGRPNLGNLASVEAYRLLQFGVRDILEQRFGADEADLVLYDAGFLAGQHVYEHLIGTPGSFSELISTLQTVLRELRVGVLRVEEADVPNGRFVLTVSEDLDCSGLPELDYEVCTYDEGFLAAILGRFLGAAVKVKEVDCWCTGGRTCRFVAETLGARRTEE